MIVIAFVSSFSVGAVGTVNKGNVTAGQTVQAYINYTTTHRYKFVPDENQYYRFEFFNQSVETRVPLYVSFGDLAAALYDSFFGGLIVVIYDQNEAKLAQNIYMGGYKGAITLNLTKGQSYYIEITARQADGNYRFSSKKLADIGSNTWEDALDVIPTETFVSAVDATSDQDWFTFLADSERSYYHFQLENISGTSRVNFTLYQYVAGAGEFPMREIQTVYASKGNTTSFNLQLDENSRYYYKIYGDGVCTGGYQLDATQKLDAAGNMLVEAYPIQIGTTVTTSFDGSSDYDYYSFRTDKDPAYYHFDVNFMAENQYYEFYILDANGDEIKYTRQYSKNIYENVKLEPDRTYYILLKGSNENYNFEVTAKKDSYSNKFEEATLISAGKEYNSSFEGTEDYDYMKFETGSTPAYYHFDVKYSAENQYYRFYLLDKDRKEVDYLRWYEDNIYTNVKLESNTTYYILLIGSNENYKLKITEKKDSYSDKFEEATLISAGKEYNSSFEGTEDYDYMKFETGSTPAYYHFDVKYSAENQYYRFYLLDKDRKEVDYLRWYEDNIYTNVKLESNTTYYILLIGSNENYKLKITEKKDSYSDKFEEATLISVGKEYASAFEGTEDYDYIKFKTGSSSAYYHFDVTYSAENQYYRFYLLDKDRNEIEYLRWYEDNIYTAIKLDTNTTYYILLIGSNENYKLKITSNTDADSDEKEKATSIKLNTPKESRLETSNDTDWFKIQINSPGEYRVRCNSLSSTSVDYDIYNSYDGSVSMGNYGTYLEPGTYYVKITGKAGYYSFIFADCGSGHKETATYVSKSTTNQSGVKKTECKSCKQLIKTETVPQIKSISLSATSLVYDGDTSKPKVVVTDAKGEKITSYSLVWSDSSSTLPGKYTVTVNFKGAYSGSKKLTYSIKPSQVKKLKTSSVKTTEVKLSWSKVKGNVQYEVYYSANGKKWTKATTTKKTAYTLKKLKSGTAYKYRVRAVTVTGSLKGAYSTVLTSATKPATVKLSKLTAGSKQLTAAWKTVSGATGYEVVYSTSKKFTKKTTKKVTIKKAKTKKTTIKKLKKGKKYYVKVRAYKTVSGKKIYGAYSSAKSIKVK